MDISFSKELYAQRDGSAQTLAFALLKGRLRHAVVLDAPSIQ